MSTEDYSKKIWDMLDNPQAYSEEEILALLHDNEEAREAYRQIVRRGSGLQRSIRWKSSGIGRYIPVGLQVRESMPPLASQS